MTAVMDYEPPAGAIGRAFATLVAKHCDAVYRIAENICASVADAEKVTRLTFISAYRDATSRPGGVSFRTCDGRMQSPEKSEIVCVQTASGAVRVILIV